MGLFGSGEEHMEERGRGIGIEIERERKWDEGKG